MKSKLTLLFLFIFTSCYTQGSTIFGSVVNDNEEPVIYANLALFASSDSTLVKVQTSDDNGYFKFQNIPIGTYYMNITYVGLNDFNRTDINVTNGSENDLGTLTMTSSSVELETAIVTAQRAMVEVKPDRTVFNVQGTINSTGDNGLELLRKAPGVLVDNNNNITVLSRNGVLVYVDGKRLPLSGDDLIGYLQNLTADQIDRFDIITSPGAKYEAEGNAGIIDIRLKKDKNLGANGSINANYTKTIYWRTNLGGSGNYRNKKFNVFGQLGVYRGRHFEGFIFDDYQNGVRVKDDVDISENSMTTNARIGTDYFINKHNTIGLIVSGNLRRSDETNTAENLISSISTPNSVDSILIANNTSDHEFDSQSFNLNYAFDKSGKTVNVDADYGRYRRRSDFFQPNIYYQPDATTILTEVNTQYNTPVDIDIFTFKIDYEMDLLEGRLGLGTKYSKVETDNTFLFYDIPNSDLIRNDRRSNQFIYDENVYAGYFNYSRAISEKWNFSAGLRMEQTEATGDLRAFLEELQEEPVELSYLQAFPSAGLTYQLNPTNTFSLNYGRRINRPDYNVLNPFKSQVNELSFSKGNPFLKPEIVNNFELGYTLQYRYNFKLAYSKTIDQITRLIGPDDSDIRARFINWDNLAEQIVYSLNISAPIQVSEKINTFINFSLAHQDNQADYGDGAIVDLQVWTYSFYSQNTINLPKGFTGEVSGWFSGPGIWGGVFKYEEQWSLNLGLSKKFLEDRLNVKLSVQDIFKQAGWSGVSEFNGLTSNGQGDWDSRRASFNITYQFGNSNVKSRDRKTGIQDEEDRVN